MRRSRELFEKPSQAPAADGPLHRQAKSGHGQGAAYSSPLRGRLHPSSSSSSALTIAERQAKQYHQLVAACSYATDGVHRYQRWDLPGDTLLQFLAPNPAVHRRQRGKKQARPLLSLWMPDTVVYCGRDGPLWIYSDKDGKVRSTRDSSVHEGSFCRGAHLE